jgi:hypothetical protein
MGRRRPTENIEIAVARCVVGGGTLNNT